MQTILPSQYTAVSDETVIELNTGFEWLTIEANTYQSPADIDNINEFSPAIVPGTVALMVEDQSALANLDAQDHWYRTQFSAMQSPRTLLHLDGLLTFADVYLNGELILQSYNAYHVHIVDITQKIQLNNTLHICFRAIKPFYTGKKPRAKYITRLANERHLRFIRTPLLGYTPGFSAATKAVGPYRPIRLIYQKKWTVLSSKVDTQLLDDSTGLLSLEVMLDCIDSTLASGSLVLYDADKKTEVKRTHLIISQDAEGIFKLSAQLTSNAITAYWPHTYGNPKRYEVLLVLNNGQIKLGDYGFRRIERISQDHFALRINGVAMYLRGACWTPMNATSLLSTTEALRQRLTLLRDFGINMLRVPGNMLYESDDFYSFCDELGILVYQEFAFSNYDYPSEDIAFIESIQKEAKDFLSKHGGRACLTVLSGGSEVAQQASMMGLSTHETDNRIFTHYLPEIIQQLAPNIPYAISTPYSSKGLPFHAGDGPCNYHGVGGYQRSFEDARAFSGRFIAECLPFSHVPEDDSLRQFWGGEILPPHHPLWKDGVPRDPGSGWDFSETTDFYANQLYQVDPVSLRAIDQVRYLNYCRAALVETVETTLSIFRASAAQGRAALVWNLHDLKQGAGWGYIDSLGTPKSAFYALGRTSQPTTLLFVDEGLEGLAVYLTHDGAHDIDTELTLSLVTAEGKLFEQQTKPLHLAARSIMRISVDTFIGHFVDSSYAYHFGPRAFTSCVATLNGADKQLISQKVYAHPSQTHQLSWDIQLSAVAKKLNSNQYSLTISSNRPAFYISIQAPDFQASDNYFHVIPGFDQQVILKLKTNASAIHGRVQALNSNASFAVEFRTT